MLINQISETCPERLAVGKPLAADGSRRIRYHESDIDSPPGLPSAGNSPMDQLNN
jgi:hypothetical protein